jgi:hypothetical protein
MRPSPPLTEKRKELARPTFRHRLSRHLRRLRLDLADIGGNASLRETIGIRDSLIHAADEPAIDQIASNPPADEPMPTMGKAAMLSLAPEWICAPPVDRPPTAHRGGLRCGREASIGIRCTRPCN